MSKKKSRRLAEIHRNERGYKFHALPAGIPTIAELDDCLEDGSLAATTIHAHYFLGGFDWYIAAFDPWSGMAYGYVSNAADPIFSEWGYISLPEIEALQVKTPIQMGRETIYLPVVVERDLQWTPRPFEAVRLPAGTR